MKALVAAAVLIAMPVVPAFAQSVPGGVSASVEVNRAAIDPQHLAALRCKLGFVNPRACIQQPAPPQRATASRGRGNRAGIASGARRPSVDMASAGMARADLG